MNHWGALPGLAAVLLAAGMFGGTVSVGSQALAMGSAPPSGAPTVDCRKRKNRAKKVCFCKRKANKNHPRCQSAQGQKLNDDQLYQAAYWLAQDGKYEKALIELNKAENKDDPRILNYIGFSIRKLGRVDEALGYYRKALAANPDYTLARAYMGEAFLEQGKPALAREQLSEIEKRCGRSCAEFTELSTQIASYDSTGKFAPQGKRDGKLEQQS